MINFFDLVYNVRKKFENVSELEYVNEQSNKIQSFADDEWDGADDTIDVNAIGKLFQECEVLDVYKMDRMFHYLDELDPNGFVAVNDFVADVYSKIAGFKFDDQEKFETYRLFLSMLKKTRGSVVRGTIPEIDEDKDLVDDETVRTFMDSFDELIKLPDDEHSLYNLLHFVYENNFNSLNSELMERKDDKTKDIPNDLKVVVPVLEAMYKQKKFMKGLKNDLYDIIVHPDDCESDTDYIDRIEKANKVVKVVKYDLSKIREAVSNLDAVSNDKKIFIHQMDGIVESEKTFKMAAPDAAAILKDGATIASAYAEINNVDGEGNLKSKKIKNDADMKKVQDGLNAAINYALKAAADKVYNFEKDIIIFNELIQDDFKIQVLASNRTPESFSIAVNLLETIDKWKAFIKQGVYRYGFGDNLLKDINERTADLYEKANPKYQYLTKEATADVITIISKIDVKSGRALDSFDSIKKFLKNLTRWSDGQKMKGVIEVLRYLQSFFQTPFSGKVDLAQGKMLNKYYDAACTLIYFKDKSLGEAYEADVETMLFEGHVLFEENNWTEYFKKALDKFKAYADTDDERPSKEKNIVTYVADNEDNFDMSSVNDDSGSKDKEKKEEEKSDEKYDESKSEIEKLRKELAQKVEELKEINNSLEQEREENETPIKQTVEMIQKEIDSLQNRLNSLGSKTAPEETTSSVLAKSGN